MVKKVLVMDADLSILAAIEKALSCENIQVRSVAESMTVLKFLSDYKPDIVLLDYLMTLTAVKYAIKLNAIRPRSTFR